MKRMTKDVILAYLKARGILNFLNQESLRQNGCTIYNYLDNHPNDDFVDIITLSIIWGNSELGTGFWINEHNKLHEWYEANMIKKQSCTPKFKVYQVVTIHIDSNFNYFNNKMYDYDDKKVTIKQVFTNDHSPNGDDGCLYYIEEDNQQFVWTSQYFN